jgi:predicted nuclease of predicted toxin-antitoxin system
MKVLFDQNVPRRLRRSLFGHEVKTAREQEWDWLRNGRLLQVAEEAGFDVFITADRNLAYQQNLEGRKIAIIELTRNNWPLIHVRLEEIAVAVNECEIGDYRIVDCSKQA